MIKCPECQKDVSESAEACPSCGYPVKAAQKEKESLEKKKGCGGCLLLLGILIFIVALGTFVFANKSARDLIQNTWETSGSDRVMGDDALAKAAGHESYSDYLADQNRNSGILWMGVAGVLIIIGYNMAKGKGDKP